MSNNLQAQPPDGLQDVAQHVRWFLHLEKSEFVSLIREAINEWVDDNAQRLSASLAYYTLLSLAPLLVVATAIAAFAFGKKAVDGQLAGQIQYFLGRDGAIAVQGLLKNANHPGAGVFATVTGITILFFAASSAVIELEDALNTIWQVPTPAPTSKWGSVMATIKTRVYSFALILGAGLLLLISLVLNASIALVDTFFNSLLPTPTFVLRVAEFVVAFCVTTILFAAIYKSMPAVRLKWSDVFIGAGVTSVFFTLGKQLVGFYLGREAFSSTYGAAGSLIAVLVWIYYSAQLFFVGAEFTKVYARRLGSRKATELTGQPKQ